MVALEIAVTDTAGLRAAHSGGAVRVELCAALPETGGITPSLGVAERLVQLGLLPVHVLVRPRPGDFVYDGEEVETMLRDIQHFRDAGVAGVVVGALTEEGRLDECTLARLSDAAGDLCITWHRMVDVFGEPAEVVTRAFELGAARILTSGGAATAADGLATLANMVEASQGRVEIMAGGGVRASDVPQLVATGVAGIHLSASRWIGGGPVGPGGGNPGRTVTDSQLVADVAALLTVSQGRAC